MQVDRWKNVPLFWVILLVLRKLMFSLAFMWSWDQQQEQILNLLEFSIDLLYKTSLNILYSFKDKIYKLAGMICPRFFVPFVQGGYEDLTLSLKRIWKHLFGFKYSSIDFVLSLLVLLVLTSLSHMDFRFHFCIPETYIFNVIMISAKISQICWIIPLCWRWQRNMEKHLHKFCFVTLCNEA